MSLEEILTLSLVGIFLVLLGVALGILLDPVFKLIGIFAEYTFDQVKSTKISPQGKLWLLMGAAVLVSAVVTLVLLSGLEYFFGWKGPFYTFYVILPVLLVVAAIIMGIRHKPSKK